MLLIFNFIPVIVTPETKFKVLSYHLKGCELCSNECIINGLDVNIQWKNFGSSVTENMKTTMNIIIFVIYSFWK